jgi:hypothetical protein
VVCHLPVPLLGARPQSPPLSSCPRARKMLHRASVPCPWGTLTVCHAHRSPEGDPHVIHSSTFSLAVFKNSVNFGELSAPLIFGARGLAPRPPYGDGSCRPEGPTLGLCHRPSLFATHIHLIILFYAMSLLRGAVCSPSSKVGDLRPPTPVHLTGTSSDERNR